MELDDLQLIARSLPEPAQASLVHHCVDDLITKSVEVVDPTASSYAAQVTAWLKDGRMVLDHYGNNTLTSAIGQQVRGASASYDCNDFLDSSGDIINQETGYPWTDDIWVSFVTEVFGAIDSLSLAEGQRLARTDLDGIVSCYYNAYFYLADGLEEVQTSKLDEIHKVEPLASAIRRFCAWAGVEGPT